MFTTDLMFTSLLFYGSIIGIGATVVMDLWAFALKLVFGVPSLNYRFVGRWLGYISKGIFMHKNIATVTPFPGEAIIGWCFHYFTGCAFALTLLLIAGKEWLLSPVLTPAILVGIGTVFFPFFIMQPCLGLGVAASRTPSPTIGRIRSLVNHTVFGFGLYLSGWFLTV